MQLDKGASMEEIREKIANGEIQTDVEKQMEAKSNCTSERIQRKKRDLTKIINKYAAESGEEVSQKPKTLSAVQLFAEAKEAEEGDLVMKKKIFELADNQLLKDAGDGERTAKSLLETIASMESEAQKSFMHRFNIAADLLDEALDAGELGLAGIVVWMR